MITDYEIKWHDTPAGRVFAIDHGGGLKTAGKVGEFGRIEIITTLDDMTAITVVAAKEYAIFGDEIIRDVIRQQVYAMTREAGK